MPIFHNFHITKFFTFFLVNVQANIVCKEMGFLSAASFSVKSKYGSVPSSFSFGKISCSGDESSLNECSQFLDKAYCFRDYGGAGVACKDNGGMT